jgi:pyruvate,water dikinase
MDLPEMNIAKLKKVAKERYEKYSNEIELVLPTVISSRTMFEQSKVDEAKTYLNGIAVSPGYVQGELFFINNPLQQIPSGSIIVLPTAGPEYAHLYSQAKGIIFQKGGILSHGAIITREFRIPALVVQNSEKIRTWENKQVVLDAQKARIILSKE